jgi:AcrR family transcriptional regulator
MGRKENRTKRPYRSTNRAAAAEGTRQSIVDAAHRLFVERGFNGMTMEGVATEAGVALDTVYAAVGPKATLVRLLVETAISGTDEAVDAEGRDYVQRIRAASTAAEKLTIYAHALRHIHPRLAPVVQRLRAASSAKPELATLWQEIADRRRRNMETFAADLLATPDVRPDLDREELADVLWTMGAPEFYVLLVEERGWTPPQFEAWLGSAWQRLFVSPTGAPAGRR